MNKILFLTAAFIFISIAPANACFAIPLPQDQADGSAVSKELDNASSLDKLFIGRVVYLSAKKDFHPIPASSAKPAFQVIKTISGADVGDIFLGDLSSYGCGGDGPEVGDIYLYRLTFDGRVHLALLRSYNFTSPAASDVEKKFNIDLTKYDRSRIPWPEQKFKSRYYWTLVKNYWLHFLACAAIVGWLGAVIMRRLKTRTN